MNLTDRQQKISRDLPANGYRWTSQQIKKLPKSQQPRWIEHYKGMLEAYDQAGVLYQNTVSRDFFTRLREAVAVTTVTASLLDELADICADLPLPAVTALRRAADKCDTPQTLANLVDRVISDLTPTVTALRQWGLSPDANYNEINRRAVELANEWKTHEARTNPAANGYWLGDQWVKTGDNPTDTETDEQQPLHRHEDAAYWRKQIKGEVRRAVESVTMSLEHAGIMHPQQWVSTTAKARHKIDRTAAADFAQRRAFVSNAGEVIPAATLLDPAEIDRRRYAEYSARWEGICELSEEEGNGYSAMLTATLPPEYHRMIRVSDKITRPNKNWNGANPRECHDLFQSAWAKTRARWAKESIKVNFIRAAQPHKDGTPHYHITVLVRDKFTADRAAELLQDSIISTMPTERLGDYLKHGVDVMPLVNAEGKPDPAAALKYGLSALAYLLPSNDSSRSQEEIESIHEWSKIWGIRRFTTSEGHSTLWKEMRKTPDTGHPAQAAAKAGDYAGFIRALRSAEANGSALGVYTVDRVNKYGETYKKPQGWRYGITVIEREFEWLQVWLDEVKPQNPDHISDRVTVNHKHQAATAEAVTEPLPASEIDPIFAAELTKMPHKHRPLHSFASL